MNEIKSSFFSLGTNWNLKIRPAASLHDLAPEKCSENQHINIYSPFIIMLSNGVRWCRWVFEIRIFKTKHEIMWSESRNSHNHSRGKVHPKNKNKQTHLYEAIIKSVEIMLSEHTHSRLSIIIVTFWWGNLGSSICVIWRNLVHIAQR